MTAHQYPPDVNPEKPDLQPPDAGFEPPRKRNLFVILLVAFTLFILLDIAIFAYFFLVHTKEKSTVPDQRQEHHVEALAKPESTGMATVQPSAGPEELIRAEEYRRLWLKQQAMAEADDIGSWGGVDFTRITGIAAKAERFLANREYGQAGELFQQAEGELAALLEAKSQRLAMALQAGNQALAAGDGRAAEEAFSKALAISSDDQQGLHGLNRAKTLDQVLSLYHEASGFEERGDFKTAQTLLGRARDLDSEYDPVTQALDRIQSRIEEMEFQQAMGGFLEALAAGKTKAAAKKLDRAATLRPQSPAVQEGRKQLQQLTTEQALARLHKEYNELAGKEQWLKARQSSEQALKIDPRAAFALAGLQAAEYRIELDQALRNILDHPQRLQEQDVLLQARQTLAAAQSVVDQGPLLQNQLKAVDHLLESASREVPVILQSDNETEVVIYRIGRQGKFIQRELLLRPGQYTVFGSRPGYRDVRKLLDIHAGDERVSLEIGCKELI